jgi:hypothetical protein
VAEAIDLLGRHRKVFFPLGAVIGKSPLLSLLPHNNITPSLSPSRRQHAKITLTYNTPPGGERP